MQPVRATPAINAARQQIHTAPALARSGSSGLAAFGWVSSVVGLALALGGPPLYYQVLFPSIAETRPTAASWPRVRNPAIALWRKRLFAAGAIRSRLRPAWFAGAAPGRLPRNPFPIRPQGQALDR